MDTNTPSKTARHFDEGAVVFHKTYGRGVILIGIRGDKYPRFDNGTTGTTSTRVWPAEDAR